MDVADLCSTKKPTGEEPAHELASEEVPGHGLLGLHLDEDKVAAVIQVQPNYSMKKYHYITLQKTLV